MSEDNIIKFRKRISQECFVLHDEVEDRAIEVSTAYIAELIDNRRSIAEHDHAMIRALLTHLLEIVAE